MSDLFFTMTFAPDTPRLAAKDIPDSSWGGLVGSGWGGARPGAGRPRTKLAVLVAEHRFDYMRQSHRRALLEDEFELAGGDPRAEELARFQAVYRRHRGTGPDAVHLAVYFGRLANTGRGFS